MDIVNLTEVVLVFVDSASILSMIDGGFYKFRGSEKGGGGDLMGEEWEI